MPVVVEVTCQIEGNKWEKELGRHRWRRLPYSEGLEIFVS